MFEDLFGQPTKEKPKDGLFGDLFAIPEPIAPEPVEPVTPPKPISWLEKIKQIPSAILDLPRVAKEKFAPKPTKPVSFLEKAKELPNAIWDTLGKIDKKLETAGGIAKFLPEAMGETLGIPEAIKKVETEGIGQLPLASIEVLAKLGDAIITAPFRLTKGIVGIVSPETAEKIIPETVKHPAAILALAIGKEEWIPWFRDIEIGKSYQTQQEENIAAGMNPWLSGLAVMSNVIFDAAITGGMAEGFLRGVAKKAPSDSLAAKEARDIIGVKKGATPAEIKKAYRAKAHILHPDKPTTGNEALFKELNKANQTLTGVLPEMTRFQEIANALVKKRSVWGRVAEEIKVAPEVPISPELLPAVVKPTPPTIIPKPIVTLTPIQPKPLVPEVMPKPKVIPAETQRLIEERKVEAMQKTEGAKLLTAKTGQEVTVEAYSAIKGEKDSGFRSTSKNEAELYAPAKEGDVRKFTDTLKNPYVVEHQAVLLQQLATQGITEAQNWLDKMKGQPLPPPSPLVIESDTFIKKTLQGQGYDSVIYTHANEPTPVPEYQVFEIKAPVKPTEAIPKELQPLAQEAKKYKSAEEFLDEYTKGTYNNKTGKKIRDAMWKLETEGKKDTLQYKKLEDEFDVFSERYTDFKLQLGELVDKKELNTFYNQATKEVKPTKPKPTPKEIKAKIIKEKIVAKGKPAKVAKSIQAKAKEKGIAKKFEGLAEYQPVVIKEQIALIEKLMSEDIEKAKLMALGEIALDKDIKGAMLLTMMEDYAMAQKDGAFLLELAKSPLVSETSEAGQTLRLIREREPDSAAAKMQEVKKERDKVAKKKRKGKTEKQVKSDMKQDLETKMKTKVSRYDWNNLISELLC